MLVVPCKPSGQQLTWRPMGVQMPQSFVTVVTSLIFRQRYLVRLPASWIAKKPSHGMLGGIGSSHNLRKRIRPPPSSALQNLWNLAHP